MACNLNALAGISLDCDSTGGLSAIYAAYVESVTGVTIDPTTQEVTGITMTSGLKFKQFAFRKGNASFTVNGSRDDKAGTSFFTTDINMLFNRMEKAKRLELQHMFKSNCYVIAKDNNGEYHLIGYDHEVNAYAAATTLTAQSGAEWGEANQYNLTLSAQTKNMPYHVASAVVASVI